jgi:hypothetical protein
MYDEPEMYMELVKGPLTAHLTNLAAQAPKALRR